MLRRLVPHPPISLAILALGLALASSISPGHLVLSAAIALAVPWLTRAFWADRPPIVEPLAAAWLFLVVMRDIVVANWQVARLVVGPTERLRPGFVEVPLALTDWFVATILGSIVSLTPGTVAIDIDRERAVLLVHVLDLDDPQALIATIKSRYEAPLKEIFAC
jgi:multicomponent K+:H+ antiporter subunit E